MTGPRIGEIHPVELDHRLVGTAASYPDIGLDTLAPAFANVDRRAEPKQLLERPGLRRRNARSRDNLLLSGQILDRRTPLRRDNYQAESVLRRQRDRTADGQNGGRDI